MPNSIERFVFHAGEPEQDPELLDEKHGEARQADAHWENENRTSWQLHSKWGPNPDAEGIAKKRAAIPFEELVNPMEPHCIITRIQICAPTGPTLEFCLIGNLMRMEPLRHLWNGCKEQNQLTYCGTTAIHP